MAVQINAAGDLRHQNSFDLLRLSAALLVFWHHTHEIFLGIKSDQFAQLTFFKSFGDLAVGTFFAISGYLVTQSMMRSRGITSFLWKRAVRIYPGFVVFLLVVAVAVYPFTRGSVADYLLTQRFGGYILNLLFFPLNACPAEVFPSYPYGCDLIGAIWTLSSEVGMYMFLAVIMLLPKNRMLAVALSLVLILALILSGVLVNSQLIYKIGVTNLFFFLPGRVISFVAIFLVGSLLTLVPEKYIKSPLTMVGATAIYALTFRTSLPLIQIIEAFCLPLIVLSLGLRRNPVSRLTNRTGDISYGIYLYHGPIATILFVLFMGTIPGVLLWFMVLGLTLSCSYLSFHFVEKTALKLKSIRYPRQAIESVVPVPVTEMREVA